MTEDKLTTIATMPTASTSIVREEIDVQIATAKHFPRSIKHFQQEAMSMALLDEETAASCFYVLPRAGKNIEGPSVRLAEIASAAWGNLRSGSRFIGESEDKRFVICEGFAWDLQNNNQHAVREVRRIVNKEGKRFNDDMIQTTIRACSSIAFRNAAFKVIPKTYVQTVYLAAKALAVGDAQSLSARRLKMVEWFGKVGIDQQRVLMKIGKQSLEDVNLTDIETLIGLSTAIKDGDVDIDTMFPKNGTVYSAPAVISSAPLQELAENVQPNLDEDALARKDLLTASLKSKRFAGMLDFNKWVKSETGKEASTITAVDAYDLIERLGE